MDTQPKCPSCGRPLAPNAPLGLCAECLMHCAFPTGGDTASGNPAPPKPPRFVPPKPAELAPLFPQLEILEFIGQGGMGAVYRARQKQLGRMVALKILPPEVAGGAGFAERFTREARALASLSHPNIVTLYEFGQADGLYFFLMELVDGVNLQELLRAGRIAPREALAIVPQICDALQFAHDLGIVHRDIKPGNILLNRRGQVKIADFGIAKMLEADGRAGSPLPAALHDEDGAPEVKQSAGQPSRQEFTVGQVIGTPGYSAPEQKSDPQHVDCRADIYSLGVVFYEMLTGELPGQRIEAPSRKVHIDVRLDEVVLRAMEKKPERRYQQVSEVKTMVETIVQSAKTPLQPSGPEAKVRGYPGELVHQTMQGIARSWKILKSLPLFARVALAGAVLVAIAALVLTGFAFIMRYSQPLANAPYRLQSASTAAVIRVGADKPQLPWAWQELQRRAQTGQLKTNEADKIVDDVAAWMRRDYPNGYQQPLFWLGNLLGELDKDHLVAETNALGFLDAYYGAPSIEPLPHVRENEPYLRLQCNLRNVWENNDPVGFQFGLALVNEMRSITIDGQPVAVWNALSPNLKLRQFSGDLPLSGLAPGKHIVRCEVQSAFVYATNMAGLAPDAPSTEWPPAERRWIRVCQAEFVVYATDAEIVSLSEDPALDPVARGALSLGQVIIRRKGGWLTAFVQFNPNPKPGLPISVDVTLRLGEQTIHCGTLWAEAIRGESSRSGTIFTLDIGPLDPQIKEAEIVLAPNPKAVESHPGIDRIWGKEIVFSHVPLSRQDLAGAPPVETTGSK